MEGHREALRRRAVAEGKEEIAADEQDRRNRELKQGVDHGVRGDCNSCRICHEPWASSGGHRICCIPCGHVYGRSCLEALLLLARCGGTAAKCLWCAREFKDEDMLNLYLRHTEEQMMKDDDATLQQQQAPAARMHTEEQQEAAWQKTVADLAAESQRRAVLARERVGLAREMEECGEGLKHETDILNLHGRRTNLCDDCSSSGHHQARTRRSSHVIVATDNNEKQAARDAAAIMDADDIARENQEVAWQNQEAVQVLKAAQSNAEIAQQNAKVARQNAEMAQWNVEMALKALKMARLTALFAVMIPLVMAAL